jgi:hypothetical protein
MKKFRSYRNSEVRLRRATQQNNAVFEELLNFSKILRFLILSS